MVCFNKDKHRMYHVIQTECPCKQELKDNIEQMKNEDAAGYIELLMGLGIPTVITQPIPQPQQPPQQQPQQPIWISSPNTGGGYGGQTTTTSSDGNNVSYTCNLDPDFDGVR